MKTLIGLEIHTQLATKTKMFCGCTNVVDGAEANLYVCPICLGLPGTLPVINARALEMAILAGFAFKSDIAEHSKFDRKNYFYPDLPKGYQISQFDEPICVGGEVQIRVSKGPGRGKEEKKMVRLIRIHMEEDAAKVTHPADSDYSLIDFNRAGTPLIESVTEPDMSSPAEARAFAQTFRNTLRYLGVSNADMEKGQLRVDANINVIADDGRKTPISEVKNMNSFRAIERAMTFEEARHREALEEGTEGEMIKETRGWVESDGVTVPQRSKEEANDYRYFPEPDLPPLAPDKDFIDNVRKSLPELPDKKLARIKKEYGVTESIAELLVSDQAVAAYFENAASELEAWIKQDQDKVDKKSREKLMQTTANWIVGELAKHLNKAKMDIADIRITPENFAEFLKMLHRSELNSSAAQTVLAQMFLEGTDPSDIARDNNLLQESDTDKLAEAVDQVIADNEGPVGDFKAGKQQALQFLMGMVMKETKGKANPQVIQDLLKDRLK